MKNREVVRLLPAEKMDMGGFPVKQALPTLQVEQVDPFLLVHHARVKPHYDRPAKMQGVGPHPHRGFSPVTFVIEGEVHHRDSHGNNQIAKAGEVQWMNAGAGIIHSERPSQQLVNDKGVQEIIQLWINSPAADKMKTPQYIHVPEKEIPRIPSQDGMADIKLITGNYGEQQGKISGASELLMLWVKAQTGNKERITIPTDFNAAIYLVKGTLRVEGHGVVDPENLIVFNTYGDTLSIEAKSDVEYLVLSGRPINEKIAQFGPYVMNSQTEIMQALRDYQMGKMGVLIEED